MSDFWKLGFEYNIRDKIQSIENGVNEVIKFQLKNQYAPLNCKLNIERAPYKNYDVSKKFVISISLYILESDHYQLYKQKPFTIITHQLSPFPGLFITNLNYSIGYNQPQDNYIKIYTNQENNLLKMSFCGKDSPIKKVFLRREYKAKHLSKIEFLEFIRNNFNLPFEIFEIIQEYFMNNNMFVIYD